MGIMKNIRSVLPIPRAWEQDSDRKNFALRVETALRELFSRRVAQIKMNGSEISTDKNDVADLGDVAKTIYLTSDDNTWAKVWEKISILAVGETACFAANNYAIKAISDNVRNNTVYGTITRSASAVFQISVSNSNRNWIVMRLTSANSSGCTYSETVFNDSNIVHKDDIYEELSCASGDNAFVISANSRIRIDLITTNAARMGYIIVSGNSTGSAVYYKADVGSNVTVSSSGGTLTITTNNGINMFCTVYAGSISPAT